MSTESPVYKNDHCPSCHTGIMELVSSSSVHPASYGGKMAYTETIRCTECGLERTYEDILET